MAGEEEQLVVARAEPQECSRWAAICLLGCAAVTLVCVGLYPSLPFLVGYPLLMLGLFVSALSIAFLYEQLTGGNPYGEMSIDMFL
jgi:hypothetical protein